MRSVVLGMTAAAALLLAGCATAPGGDRLAEKDPLEGFNRRVWAFNRAADKVVLKPTTTVYKAATPTAARRGVRNVLNNAEEPWSFINALLQGKVGRAAHTLGRFIVNTTIGVGGLADHASKMGLDEKPEDFGQTLAVWGVNAGPYLMLPLLGPTTLRDGVGLGAEFAADPVSIGIREAGASSTVRWGITGLRVIDLRAELMEMGADKVLDSSLDPYATARSAYLQRRRGLILDQDSGSTTGSDGVSPDDFQIDEAPAAAAPGVDPKDFETVLPPAETPPAGGTAPSPQAKQPKIDAPQ